MCNLTFLQKNDVKVFDKWLTCHVDNSVENGDMSKNSFKNTAKIGHLLRVTNLNETRYKNSPMTELVNKYMWTKIYGDTYVRFAIINGIL